MPSNVISINGVPDYYVGDSKMPEFIEWLDTNGTKVEKSETREET